MWSNETDKPPSLTQLFEPPESFRAQFGWLCGYSADTHFLNDAVERFTQKVSQQRAYEGNVAIALMLDPGNAQITCTDVPGVLHLPIKRSADRPFNLLHAKVAVLGFRHETIPHRWMARLIVSTGNWTRDTLEQSIDLAWTVTISSDQLLIQLSDVSRQACADFKQAWDAILWLRQQFDLRALDAGSDDRLDLRKSLEAWMAVVASKRQLGPARVFDNRRRGLLDQLASLIHTDNDQPIARNFLAMGSGFYEAANGTSGGVPVVIKNTVATLRQAGLLTGRTEVDVYVNQRNCQAMAHAGPAFEAEGWSIRSPAHLSCFSEARELHAKFIFGASYRRNSVLCGNAWLYLGSGNLTGPGFLQKASRRGGNFEVGVVLTEGNLVWERKKGDKSCLAVTDVLPLQWSEKFESTSDALLEGLGMEERGDAYASAPVAFLTWRSDQDQSGGIVFASDDIVEEFVVLDGETACQRGPGNQFVWRSAKPAQVLVRWEGEEAGAVYVPVLDEYGRLAGAELKPVDVDQAWSMLSSFPAPPEIDDLPIVEPNPGQGHTPSSPDVGAAQYPIRQLMELVENIASKQTAMDRASWPAWCNRLEQSLILAANSAVVVASRTLGLNLLSPLWAAPFRPAFCNKPGSAEATRYEDALRRIEDAWKIATFDRLGAA
jgi:hypothetical protein